MPHRGGDGGAGVVEEQRGREKEKQTRAECGARSRVNPTTLVETKNWTLVQPSHPGAPIILIFIVIFQERPTYCLTHFTHEKTERGGEPGPRLHSLAGSKVRSEPGLPPSRVCGFPPPLTPL